jgi:hypothetical protein
MINSIKLIGYEEMLQEAKQTILVTQQEFLQNANRASIGLYWQLGKLLAKAADRHQWGKQILARFSHDLTQR